MPKEEEIEKGLQELRNGYFSNTLSTKRRKEYFDLVASKLTNFFARILLRGCFHWIT